MNSCFLGSVKEQPFYSIQLIVVVHPGHPLSVAVVLFCAQPVSSLQLVGKVSLHQSSGQTETNTLDHET